ncbi:hypothetical protein ACEPAF_8505 [Sanghuangporus sanghuang]
MVPRILQVSAQSCFTMSDEKYYVLQVICVERSPNYVKDAALHVEVKLKDTTQKTGSLDDKGIPTRKDKLTFSRSDNGDESFDVYLMKSTKLIGHVNISAAELLRESAVDNARQNLVNSEKTLWSSGIRTEDAGRIILRLETVDAQARAQIEANAAEENAKQINALVKRTDNAAEVAATVIEVMDAVIEIVDDVVQIHPLVNVSWKIVTALYRVVSHQLKTESKLVELVYKIQQACGFCAKAGNLEDRTELLKPIIRSLLGEIIQCSHFVQEYSGRNLIVRTARMTAPKEVEERLNRLNELRRELDSVIGLHTAYANQLPQQLDDLGKVLEPFKPTSDISTRPRCLEETREGYLIRIMDFVSSERAPNILWLSGAAGSGKSTVAVTVSDRCTKEGHQPVHLFFEREKSKPSSIVRTIAYELACRYPPVAREIIKSVKRNNNIKDSELKDQFKDLLLDPLNAGADDVIGPIVIILDALDESGGSVERRHFLRLLQTDFARLPLKVRILVTSRLEDDIEKHLSHQGHILHVPLVHDSSEVGLYIKYEMKEELGDLAQDYDNEIQVLCDAANGLFIWASTAVKMVQAPVDPVDNLQFLVDNVRSLDNLDGLYATALRETGIWQSRWKTVGTDILGLILVAKEAMTSAGIEAFLGLKKNGPDPILRRLQSVVSYEPGKPIRLHHASFADYLLSSDRSGDKLWHIDETKQKQAVTERCFGVMEENLRFNICGIETSFLRNKEDSGLKQRIEDAIRPHLDYACRFWAAHVCELPSEDRPIAVLTKLKIFVETHLLYWLEVLSLTEQYDRVAVRALLDASRWSTSIDKEIGSLLWEAYRLASVFAYPISQSAPHIYLSAISLWKGESPIADLYSETHPVVKIHRLGKRTPAQCIKVLKGHTSSVDSVSISPDGRFIASGSYDQTIRVWDTDSGKPMWCFRAGSGVASVAFLPDSKQVVLCSKNRMIRVFDVDNGEPVSGPFNADELKTASSADGSRVILVQSQILYFENGELVSVRFEDDIDYLSVSADGKFVLGFKGIWDAGTGKRVSEFDVDIAVSYAVSPDRRVVAGSLNGTISIWNDRGELVTGPFKAHSSYVYSVSFSQDGKRVVSGGGGEDGSIAVWDADNGRLIWGPFREHRLSITSVLFTPDGKRVISGSHDNTIRIWDVGSTDAVSCAFEAHTGPVISVAFSADGKRLVSGSDDHTIRIWNADTGKHLLGPLEGHTDGVYSVAFFPDGKRIVSASLDRTIRIWDANSGKLVLEPMQMHSSGISLPVSTDGKRILSGMGSIFIWDAETGERVLGPRIENVTSVALSPDGKRIVSASEDARISIWDTDSGELVLGPLEGHTGSIGSLALSPDGKRFASGSGDEMVLIWDVDSGESISGPLEANASDVLSVAFSPNSKLLVFSSWDKTICVWDVDSGGLVLGPLEGHIDGVMSVKFSPVDGTRVVSSSEDKTIRMWDVSRDEVVAGDAGKRATGARSCSPMSYDADKDVGLYSQNSARTASADCKISKWTLCDDGWVKGEEGELLIWIPEDMRTTLWTHRTISILSCQFSTKLDLLNSPVGEDWSKAKAAVEADAAAVEVDAQVEAIEDGENGYPREDIRCVEVADLCLCFDFYLVFCITIPCI